MDTANNLVSISYEKAADLVLYGRRLIKEASRPFSDALDVCKAQHEKFQKQPKFSSPQNMLWAELKAQCATVVAFHEKKIPDDKSAANLGLLYDYYQSMHKMITPDNHCAEVIVGEPKTRSIGQFLTDAFCPKKRSVANQYTRTQDYTYSL